MISGILVIDKPAGITSREVVNRVQRWFPKKTKIGHTGTLDPLATGVLVLCIGKATRLADLVQAMGKSYLARFRLGATSSTDDVDGEVRETLGVTPPNREQIDAALAGFCGFIDQVPPKFSALKVSGERAHDLARFGHEFQLKPRPVRIDAIRVLQYEWPYIDLEVDCGKGTYIRSIARDLGTELGCGGLVQTLRRTRVGPFTVEQGIGVEQSVEEVGRFLLPLSAAVPHLRQFSLELPVARRLAQGQTVRIPPRPDHEPRVETVAVVTPDQTLYAIAEDNGRGQLRPVIVLDPRRD
jgi:tRNA pseudouridine55 synthase